MSSKVSGSKLIPVLGGLLFLVLGALTGLGLSGKLLPDGAAAAGGILQAQAALARARQALTGDSASLQELPGLARRLDRAARGLPASEAAALKELSALLRRIEERRDPLLNLGRTAEDLELLAGELAERSYSLESALTLQDTPAVAAQLERLRLLADIARREVAALAAGADPSAATQPLLDAEMGMARIIRGFQEGDPELGLRAVTETAAIDVLGALADTVATYGEKLRDIVAETDRLSALAGERARLDELALRLANAPATGAAPALFGLAPQTLLLALSGAALILFLAVALLYFRSANLRRAAALQAEQTERNQQAIMRLLDELSNLADGDLTVKATVTEDITGAIADSINYAIEALRELVMTVNDSAIMVDAAARQTDVTAQQLAEASANQSKQLAAASQAIAQMTASLEEVSGNAERSSDVARHSVDVAHKGGDAVRRTIAGMNAIRETIQDTSKRIKRLGESSQEIGNIVELINDIAEQTNILALNASIQASMAGEAGRGFSVVADEVQRLAERSANATKQIEVLVRTIQADTNEAVVSMERSTTDVVGGALLAENAGAALEEIEQVSNQIASLVQSISDSAREQARSAEAVTVSMDVLQQINSETATSTSETTESIRKLAELAAQLRRSVAGFRLPAEDAAPGTPGSGGDSGEEEPELMPPEAEQAGDDAVEFADQRTA